MPREPRTNRENRANIAPRRDEEEIDFGDINNSFYTRHFAPIEDDELTKRFAQVMDSEYYIEKLPASFIDGLPNLEEKEPLPLKRIPLFSKLIRGDYQLKWSKYDKTNVRANIEFFTNNLPSFRRYRPNASRDRLDWVVKKHRLLVLEIFEYYKDRKKKSISTIENRLNAILRIMRIAYGTKNTVLYKLFSELVFQLHDMVLISEGSNLLNAEEAKKYINWYDVLKIQKKMESTFSVMRTTEDVKSTKLYDYNNDLLLLSLYTLIPPLRNEVKFLEFTHNPAYARGDCIFISRDMKTIILKFHLVKKLHPKIQFDITASGGKFENQHLANIIRESYKLYPRRYVFTVKNEYPTMSQKASLNSLNTRLINIFFRNGIYNRITVNSLRSSYVSYRFSKRISYNKKKLIAFQMRTSVLCLDRSYNKIVDLSPILKENDQKKKDTMYLEVIEEGSSESPESESSESQDDPNSSDNPMDMEDANNERRTKRPETGISEYERKLQKDKEYYNKNKEKIRQRQNEYKNTLTGFEKTRARMLLRLNTSADYAERMKDTTRDKYKFVYDEAKGKWKFLTD